jgi:hypothetical protein
LARLLSSRRPYECLYSQTITIRVAPDRVRNILVVHNVVPRHDGSLPKRRMIVMGFALLPLEALPEIATTLGDLTGAAGAASGAGGAGGAGGSGGFAGMLEDLIKAPGDIIGGLVSDIEGDQNNEPPTGGSAI